MTSDDFERTFQELTGNRPLLWQVRLFKEFLAGDLKSVIDLPHWIGEDDGDGHLAHRAILKATRKRSAKALAGPKPEDK